MVGKTVAVLAVLWPNCRLNYENYGQRENVPLSERVL